MSWQKHSNFIEIALRHGCYPVSLLHIFRTPFLKNSSGWLLLSWTIFVFYTNNHLAVLQILSYQKWTVAAPICSKLHIKFYLPSWPADVIWKQYRFYFKTYLLSIFPKQNNNWTSSHSLAQKATTFLPLWNNFEIKLLIASMVIFQPLLHSLGNWKLT